jgi:hypothetical protein
MTFWINQLTFDFQADLYGNKLSCGMISKCNSASVSASRDYEKHFT